MLRAGRRGARVRTTSAAAVAAGAVRRKARPFLLLARRRTVGAQDNGTTGRSVCVVKEQLLQNPRKQQQPRPRQQLIHVHSLQKQPLSSTALLRRQPLEEAPVLAAAATTTIRGGVSAAAAEKSSPPYPAMYALMETLTQTLIPSPAPLQPMFLQVSRKNKSISFSINNNSEVPLGLDLQHMVHSSSSSLSSSPSATSLAWLNDRRQEYSQQQQQEQDQHPWLYYFENLGQVSTSGSGFGSSFVLFQNLKEEDDFPLFEKAKDESSFSSSRQLQQQQFSDLNVDEKCEDEESYKETSVPFDPQRSATRIKSTSTSTRSSPGASLDHLKRAVKRNDRQGAILEFNRLVQSTGETIPLDLVRSLFQLVGRHRSPPFFAFRLLRYYQHHHRQEQIQQASNVDTGEGANADFLDLNPYVDMYKSICYNLRFLDPAKQDMANIQQLVRVVVADLGGPSISDENKRCLYPILISSLLLQRAASVGEFAGLAFAELQALTTPTATNNNDNNDNTNSNASKSAQPPVDDGFLEHLLGLARYQRHGDMPYAQILAACAQTRRPYPSHAVQVLEYLFPFPDRNLKDTMTALQALVDLQSQTILMETVNNDDNNDNTSSSITEEKQVGNDKEETKKMKQKNYQYIVDISTLEAIGASAARQGNLDLSLLVWEAVQVMGYRVPSEAIYENLVLVFCSSPQYYDSAFAVLAEMEERGVPVSRALIRSISLHFRDSARNLDSAMNQLKTLRQNGLTVTTAMLNAILSGGAERGDIDRTLSLLDEFPRNNLQPNADSYSFALEALGKNLSRRTRNPPGSDLVGYCLDTASAILTRMDEQDIAPTHHVIRDYVELLCVADEVETATEVMIESIQNDPRLVNNKTIYRVAMANVGRKQFEIARKVAGFATEPLPFLLRAIEKNDLGEPFVQVK